MVSYILIGFSLTLACYIVSIYPALRDTNKATLFKVIFSVLSFLILPFIWPLLMLELVFGKSIYETIVKQNE